MHLIQRNLIQHISRPLHTKKLASNPDSVGAVSKCSRSCRISGKDALQRGRKVDICGRFFLDSLYYMSFLARNDRVHFMVYFANLSVKATLGYAA